MGPEPSELDAAYTAAHEAFIEHVSGCYCCRRRGIDCQAIAPIKARLSETRSASIAARLTAGTTIAAQMAAAEEAPS